MMSGRGKWLIVLVALLVLVGLIVLSPKPVEKDAPKATELCNVGWNNEYRVAGHDGAYSLLLPDGRRFWTFADTWIGEIAEGRRRVETGLHSTGAVQKGEDLCSSLAYLTDEAGKVRQLIPGPTASEETAHWPLAMVLADDRVYLYYLRVRKNDKPVLEINFDVIGVGLVSADTKSLVFEMENDGELLFSAEEHGFADALYSDGTYIYGLGCPPLSGRFDRPCRLARIPIQELANRSSYQIWDGKAWQRDLKQGVVVVDSGGSEMTLTRHKGKFLLVYMPPFSCDIQLRTAAELTGPWSKPQTLYRGIVPEEAFCYAAKLHKISDDGRELELTWTSNGPLDLHARDPNLYWPHAVKIFPVDGIF